MRKLTGILAIVGATLGLLGCGSSSGPSGKGCGGCGDDYVVNADIWGAPEGDLFIAGYRGEQTGLIKHWEGGVWKTIDEDGHAFASLWGTSAQDFFFLDIADPAVGHYNHGTWERWVLGASLNGGAGNWQPRALWGTANDDLFVAGSGGIIVHFDGTGWQRMTTPTTALLKGLWGSAHDNVIAVGDAGTILRYDGNAWSSVPSPSVPSMASFNAVWGAAANQVFIVGELELEVSHVIVHFDGATASVAHQGDKALLGVHGTGPDRVYAVGASRSDGGIRGGVFRFDGAQWTEVPVGVSQFLWDVWVKPDGSYVAVGPDDTVVNGGTK